MTDPVIVPVRGAGDYDVVIGRDLGDRLADALGAGVKKVLVVHQPVQAKRAEAMVALVVADALLEKFGGDSLPETRRNLEAYLESIPATLRTAAP